MPQVSVSADVAAALADPEVARAAGAVPLLLIGGAPPKVRWANQAALTLFQAADYEAVTETALAGADPGAKRFRQLARLLKPTAPPRVESLRFRLERGLEGLTWRFRRLGPPADLLVASHERPSSPVEADARGEREFRVLRPSPQAAQGPQPVVGSRAGAAELRADLARRFPGVRALRFLWRAAKDNHVSYLDGAFCEVVGCPPEALVGQDLAEAAARLGLDSDHRLRDALEGRETWAKIRVLWPVTGAAAALPVSFGAVPSFGADRAFEGWRGFGVVDLLAPEDRSAAAQAPKADREPAAAEQPRSPPAQELAASATSIESHSSFGANVVALRRLQLVRPAAIGNGSSLEVASAEAAPSQARDLAASGEQASVENGAEGERGGLTTNERQAFHEIGLALGARPPLYEHGRPAALSSPAPGAAQFPPFTEETSEPAAERPSTAKESGREPSENADGTEDVARRFLEASPFGLLISRDSKAQWLNPALLALLGYATVERFRDAGGLGRMLGGQSLGAAAPSGVFQIAATDCAGESVALEGASHAVDWLGQPATMTLFHRAERADVSRVKFLEAELRRRDAEARELHSILDTATDGVALLDDQGRLISLNRAGEALFGCDQNEVAGESFVSLLSPESHAAAQDYFSQVSSNGVASLLNDGREIVGRARRGGAIPIFMTLGRVNVAGATKFCAVLRDMTAWKKVERELNEARSEAERASALKSDFLAKVSHEIRTPLNAILGFAEVIMDERFGPVGNERYRDYLKDIHASGTHVMSLVNDLLDLSKIEAGKMELNFDCVDANKIVAECVSIMQPQANSERVIVRLSTAPRLPHVMADERSLRQIVLNLLSNAVKFNEPGGQVIVATALTDAGHAVIRIRDTGIGMSESELITALEPFRQVQTSRQTSGTGLGLPLTKALVEANRASFTVKSRKAEGTLVEVAFPPARVMVE